MNRHEPASAGHLHSQPFATEWALRAKGFATGFLISVFLYLSLRFVGAKWVLNLLCTLVMSYALFGVACGALLHSNVRRSLFVRYEPWLFALALFHFFCIAYNYNLSATYLLPINGFSLYTPEKLGWHIAAEGVVFVLMPVVFVLCGFYFADSFSDALNPYWFYAAHALGFLCGGVAGYYGVLIIGAAAALGAGIVLLLMFQFRRRAVYTLLFVTSACAVTWYSAHAPKLFYTWSNREYKHLESTWSPHFKLDFISFDNDHCIAGVYNNLFLYYTCDTPEKAHLQVRQIYKFVARDRERILVIGGSLGTAMSYMVRFQDKMKQGVSVEIDPVVEQRSVTKYAKFSGMALNNPKVKAVAMDGRRFVEKDRHKYDLIFIDGVDNGMYYAPGSLVAVENYIFTREGLSAVFDRLSPHGVLTIDLGGTTDVDSIYQYLAGFPKDVKYDLFWYVVPDRPMVGLALYFIVASKDEQALGRVVRHVKSLPSVVHLPYKPEKSPGLLYSSPTDDKPVIRSFGVMSEAMTYFCLLALAAAWIVWRGRHKARYGTPPGFPIAIFGMLGIVYIYVEFAVVLRHARLFDGPALGVVVLTSAFLFGNFLANLIFAELCGEYEHTHLAFGAFAAVFAFGMMMFLAHGHLSTIPAAIVLTLAAGVAAGWFWPMLLSIMPDVDRRHAFAADTIGCMAGGIVYFFSFISRGFPAVSYAGAFGVIILYLCSVVCFQPPELDRISDFNE